MPWFSGLVGLRAIGGGWSLSRAAVTNGRLVNTAPLNWHYFPAHATDISMAYPGDASLLVYLQCGASVAEANDLLAGLPTIRDTRGATDGPTPVASSPLSGADPAELKILTWNIWTMPWWTFQSPRNSQRAAAIAAELSALDFDILCFQNAFDRRARKVIVDVLGARYPYCYGPANSSCSVKLSSGVWVLSRIPLDNVHEIQFESCEGIECFSRKGAMFLNGVPA